METENTKETFSVRNRNVRKSQTIEVGPDDVALVLYPDGKIQVFLEDGKPSKHGALMTVILAAITDPKLFASLLKEYGKTDLIKKLTKGAKNG